MAQCNEQIVKLISSDAQYLILYFTVMNSMKIYTTILAA